MTALRECLYAMLACDEEGLRLLQLSVAVIGRAIADPAMAGVPGPSDGELLSFIADLITAARCERADPRPRVTASSPRTSAGASP
ncbi:hypothetical protein DY245_16450 [Streptomyces inhibens]|uniref:Uncharacterized protein n=1 Tax=Streptomyces inhibens TaxID=2293571 RepID=A0A371Q4Q4_STRIH|nr:hypothetical protein DY245_16450 [Streptomyces inhibens]